MKTMERYRDLLLSGRSLPQIAKEAGCSKQNLWLAAYILGIKKEHVEARKQYKRKRYEIALTMRENGESEHAIAHHLEVSPQSVRSLLSYARKALQK
jgi:biotin operon repressor